MTYATKDHLIKGGVKPTDLTLPSGLTVRIRGLSGRESRELPTTPTEVDSTTHDGAGEVTRRAVALGLVTPAMTLDEVTAWEAAEGSMADYVAVADGIQRLSAGTKEAAKSNNGRPARRR